MPTVEEVQNMLTGPGAVFEVVTEPVNGIEMKVYKERNKSLRELSRMASLRNDSDIFIVFGEERISFPRFVERSDIIGVNLASLGINKGDRVAVLSANNPEWCLSFWATIDIGGILVGLNGWWKADEIIYGLKHSESKILIADRDRFRRISNFLPELQDLNFIFVIDPEEKDLIDDRVRDFKELEKVSSNNLLALERDIDEDDAAVIFYTSGTTGRPKGAVSTHRSMIANLQNTFYTVIAGSFLSPGRSLLPEGDSTQIGSLITSPLFHVTGCHSGLVVGIASGLKLVFPAGKQEPEKILKLIQDEKISIWTGVPTMVWRVLEEAHNYSFDYSSLKSIAYGGSPSGADLQRRIKEVFPNVKSMSNGYGLTESSSVATLNSGSDIEKYPESVGRPLPVIELKIMKPDSSEAELFEIGEVCIKGPTIMPGYWQDPEATAAMIKDGWLNSGDVGYVNDEGLLFITDRAKDMIIRGGENVYSVEIENRLVEHPLISEAAVIGVPHAILGEQVKAIVHVESGAKLSEDEIKDWVRETLADFKVPEFIEFRDSYLPRNPSGKILKNVLRGKGEVSFEQSELD